MNHAVRHGFTEAAKLRGNPERRHCVCNSTPSPKVPCNRSNPQT